MRLNSKTAKWLRTLSVRRAIDYPLTVPDGYEQRKRLGTREIPIDKDVIKVPILGPIRLNQGCAKWFYRRLKNDYKKGRDL